jgi:hypothetical protein
VAHILASPASHIIQKVIYADCESGRFDRALMEEDVHNAWAFFGLPTRHSPKDHPIFR